MSDGILKLEEISIEVKKWCSLWGTIIDGIHQPCAGYVFQEEGEYLIGEAKQPLGRASSLIFGCLEEGVKLGERLPHPGG